MAQQGSPAPLTWSPQAMSRLPLTPALAPTRLPGLPDVLGALESGSLPAHAFDHRAHVFAAWAAMTQHGVCDGAKRFRCALRAYTQHLQAPDKFHVTITEALLRLVAAAIQADANPDRRWQAQWHRFDVAASHLFQPSRAVLAAYYSDAHIHLPEARQRFLAPDLQALPCTDLDRAHME